MSQEINSRELTEQHIFENMSEFYEYLKPTPFDTLEPRLTTFNIFYGNINKGCGCKKKVRVSKALDAYKDLKNLNKATRHALKENIYVNKIVFRQDGEDLFEF